MTDHHRLTPDERAFFALLAEVIFSNPFSTGYAEVEVTLGVRLTPAPGEHLHLALLPAVDERLRQLEARGIDGIGAIAPADRAPLEYAYLFRLYEESVDDFDALIRDQVRRGDEPAPVPFAPALLERMRRCGFAAEESLRYLALFYQFRRAFYFIHRALVGDSPCMKRLRHALWNNIFTADARLYGTYLWNRMEDFSTLLLGETGTGKGSAAAAIGRSGLIPFDPKTGRFRYSFTTTFVATNLSQFPESLIESELFGHKKGAFTGAIDHHKGLFERCSPFGALFLDEIGDVAIPVQIKLLNVIQERRFSPVGSHQELRFEGRVIAATHRPLDALRADGRFRDDFFYRLSSDVIEVPPLRRRLQEAPAELERLVALLVERLVSRSGTVLEEKVLAALRRHLPADYPWPGNVRELEQAVRRILLSGEYRPPLPAPDTGDPWLEAVGEGALDAQALLRGYCRRLHARHGTYEEVARRTGLDRRTVKKYAAE